MIQRPVVAPSRFMEPANEAGGRDCEKERKFPPQLEVPSSDIAQPIRYAARWRCFYDISASDGGGMTTWHFKSKSSGVEYAIELALRWEVSGDPITDDYSPDEIEASELWSMW